MNFPVLLSLSTESKKIYKHVLMLEKTRARPLSIAHSYALNARETTLSLPYYSYYYTTSSFSTHFTITGAKVIVRYIKVRYVEVPHITMSSVLYFFGYIRPSFYDLS